MSGLSPYCALKRTLVERVYELEREGAGREDILSVARPHLHCPAPGQRAALVRAFGGGRCQHTRQRGERL
jgi:hypothetical protein